MADFSSLWPTAIFVSQKHLRVKIVKSILPFCLSWDVLQKCYNRRHSSIQVYLYHDQLCFKWCLMIVFKLENECKLTEKNEFNNWLALLICQFLSSSSFPHCYCRLQQPGLWQRYGRNPEKGPRKISDALDKKRNLAFHGRFAENAPGVGKDWGKHACRHTSSPC